jgi:hypothetical protein
LFCAISIYVSSSILSSCIGGVNSDSCTFVLFFE